MICTACRHENPDRAKFCLECGAAFASRCPNCDTELPAGAKFCPECGAELQGSGFRGRGTGRPAPGADTPEDHEGREVEGRKSKVEPPRPAPYTPRHLVEKILSSRSALEGERKQVTVLFADVKGSMELAEQLDPEEWHRILDRFFAILTEGVHRFEGTVNQYTGDGIMALFGAPIAHEDHAQRACYAALHLREEIARHATEVKRQHGVGFSTRMGINSGEVVVGSIGDDLRMDYTAQGHTVGLAQRMESLASPDTCYLSATTAKLAEGYFQLEDLGEFRVKGVSAPIRVHRLVGAGAATTRFDTSRARGLTRFVGRDDDMATLEAALAQARAGNGQVVGVVAAAGTGKSRLCYEFAQRCRARGLIVNEGHAVAHGKNIPYLPMLEVFRSYFGIDEGDGDATVREKIAGRLLLLDENFREMLPVIFEFHRVPDPEHPVPRMDPEAKQRQLAAVIRRVVQDPRAGAERNFALIEDLHWNDPGSEALLAQWVDAVAGSSSLLVVNFRPEYRAEWMQKSYYRQLPLAPLGSDAIRALLADLLGDDASTRGLADEIHARTGGNPFFIEEVVQNLIESGHLVGTRGDYRLVVPIARLEVPASVQALLGARIDRLSEPEKHVLQAAAVIGKEFSEPILRRVLDATGGTGAAENELGEVLAKLKAREFLYETALYPVAEYAFKHPLTQEVALGSQLQERRRSMHAAVAQAIEAVHADKLDEHAALLAHHTTEAGRTMAAAQWHTRAARFIGRNDFAEAARHWEQVRDLVRTVPDEPGAATLAADACFAGLAMGFRVDLHDDEAEEIFREGLDRATRTGEALYVGRMHQARSVYEVQANRIDSAIAHAKEWERVARALSDPERRTSALWPSLDPLIMRGDLAKAKANALQQLEWTRDHHEWGLRDWDVSAHAGALWQLGRSEMYDGSFAQAREHLERGIDVSRRVGDPEMEGFNCGVLGELGFLADEPDLARAAVDRYVALSDRLGSLSRLDAQVRLGGQLVLDGDPDRAVRVLEDALLLRGPACRNFECRLGYYRARAALAAGDPEAARAIAEETLALSLRIGARLDAIQAALALAEAVRADAGAAASARIEERLETAERLIAETGACNLTAFVLVQRAALAELRGDTQQHEAHLREAHDLFTKMGAIRHAARLAKETGR